MNPIVCPVRNNIHLTQKAVASFRKQDIETTILIIDNDSTDGTAQWLATQKDLGIVYHAQPQSVAASWNMGLRYFYRLGAEHALVVNNDVELRPDTYKYLLKDGGEFVTAVGVRDPAKIQPEPEPPDGFEGFYRRYSRPDPATNRPHPDFSCYLIRRQLYDRVGPFDENFKIAFCEDGDYDLRMHAAGYKPHCIDLPFLHHGSMTIKNADPAEIRKIQLQADENRKYFKKKWGFAMASEEYYGSMGKGGPPAANSASPIA